MPIMTTTTITTTIFLGADNHNTLKLNSGVSLKGPLVLLADLFLFFRGEIILDIEGVWVKHRNDEVKQRLQLNSPNTSASVVEAR